MTTRIEDLVGLTEIAERCNVTKNVASGWTRKHTFPAIKHKLAMGPMWDWNEVQAHLFGMPKMEIKLLDGAMWAYVTKAPCMHCESRDISALPGAELRLDGDDTWVEFTYHCNNCQADVDRAVDLNKEDA
jgi:hypothetical protein